MINRNHKVFSADVLVKGVKIFGDGIYGVLLEEDFFYPGGGGQPQDKGRINNHLILDLKFDQDGVWFLTRIPDLQVGAKVCLEIDAEARNMFCRLHTMGHIIAHVCESNFGWQAKSSNHRPGQAKIDFEGEIGQVVALDVKKLIVESLFSCRDVRELFVIGVRTIEIPGIGSCSCGGSHVSSTSEISNWSIRYLKSKKGIISCGYDVS